MNLPADLTYDYPLAVWFFFLSLPLVFLSVAIYRFRSRIRKLFSETLVLNHAPTLFWGKVAALVAAWVLATIALMGPKGNGHYPEEGQKPQQTKQTGAAKRKAHDVVIAIDASASMGIKDARNGVTRLEYAKQIADQLISKLEGDSVALYAFTYEPALLSPATLDTLYVRLLLRSLKINEGDTAGTSLTHFLEAFQKKYLARPGRKLITLILLSDGEDNQLKNVEQLQKYIQGPSLAQAQLFTIGVGTVQGGKVPEFDAQSHLDPLSLQFIAQEGHGKYYVANDYTPISLVDALLGEMDKINPILQPGEIPASFLAGEDNLIYDLYFQIPLSLALVCLAFYLLGPNSWKRASVWLILLPLSGYALDAKKVEAAESYVEAGLYEKGEGLYMVLLNEPLQMWQESFLTYDWGRGKLLEGDPSRALEIFERVHWDKGSSPLLLQYLHANRALALYQTALKEPLDNGDSYRTALDLLREAQSSIQLSTESHCQVVQIEGSKQCVQSLSHQLLDRSIRLKIAELFSAYISLRINEMKPEERLPLLNAEFDHIVRALEGIKAKPEYRTLVLRDLAEWRPIWEKLPSNSQVRELFSELLQKINRGSEVDALLGELEKALAQETEEVFNNNPELTKRKVLEGLYQFALLQDPPLAITLRALEKVDGKNNALLQKALAALENGNKLLARFYLLAAEPSVAIQGNGAKAVLRQALNVQEKALRLNRILYHMVGTVDNVLQETVIAAQKNVVEASQPFLASVYDTQSILFNDESLSLDKRCQAEPWNEVIALYGKGREHAVKEELLTINDQNQTISYWKEALKAMDKTGSGKGCPSGGAASEEIKNVQEMDQEDRVEKKTSPVKIEGVNPW